MTAQQPGDPLKAHGKQAVETVLKHVVLYENVPTPKTGQQLPTNGHWQIGTQVPQACSQITPRSAQPCLRVNYQVPEADVSCEWVVVLKEDGSDGTIIEQNDDATRYFLQKISPQNVTPLVLRDDQPIYPPMARAANIRGVVRFQVFVAQDGRPAKAVLIEGPEMLRAAAADALTRWMFKPLIVGGRVVPFQTEVTFSLNSR